VASYLGKISAIVSANTAGYVRGINEAAAQTRNFAKAVQTDINRASRDADRSLKSILTPLQQFQRSLNAAVSQRLAFKGVDGIVTGIGQLQIKLRELQRQGSSSVDVALKITGKESVDKLVEDLDTIDNTKIRAVIETVNAETIGRAKSQLEQLFSVANEIARPLSSSVKQFEQLGAGVQASFTPALNVAQRAVQELETSIREGGRVGQDEFDRVARVVDRTRASILRLAEASESVNTLPTGQELRFQDPRFSQRIQRANQAAVAAASFDAGTIESSGVSELVSRLRQASNFALETQSRLENARAQGLTQDVSRISGQLENAGQTVDRITRTIQASGRLNILSDEDLRASRSSELAARLEADRQKAREVAEELARLRQQSEFAITGRVQNFQQVRQQLAQVIADVGRLDASTTASFDIDIGALNRIVSEEDIKDLPVAEQIIKRINAALKERRRLDVDSEEARQKAQQLEATIDRIRRDADFVITGRPQNLDQVQSELQRILGTVDRLNDEQRGSLKINAVIDAIGDEDLERARVALSDLKQQVNSGAEFNLRTEQAQKAADDVRQRIQQLDDRVEFTITGRVQNFDQARQEVNSLIGDVSRLKQEQRAAFGQRLQRAARLIESGEIEKLGRAASILQSVRDEVSKLNASPARDIFGDALDDPARQVAVLGSGITSLQGKFDTLPEPIRRRLLPDLQRLRSQFLQIEKSPARFSAEIENASNEVTRLSADIRRLSQVQNIGSFSDGRNDTAIRGAIGNLQALQQILNRVGATAGSEGARQFDRLRAAIQRATSEGTIGSEAFQRELQQITRDAAAAAAATGKIGRRAAFREITRGGDIARGGFDRLSLGAQQAAFAIDDFFSATGDFTQKIRAVQNNITQLAFIIGDTTGLFIGLGVAIAAQATVALIKWIQGSVDAEDKTQALNDALARQKSLVEELKQAFDSLGDSLTREIFDGATERARDFARQIEDIRRKSAEIRQEQAASLDSGVNEQRAIQVDLRNELENETDAGARVGIERRIAASQEEERRLARQAGNRRVDVGDALGELVQSLEEQLQAQETGIIMRASRGRLFDGAAVQRQIEPLRERTQQRIQEARARVQAAIDPIEGFDTSVFEISEILDERIYELAGRAAELRRDQANSPELEVVNQQIGELESVLRSLKAPIERALLELRLSLLDSATEVAGSLSDSKDIIANSLGGFGPLAADQRALAEEFDRITSELAAGASAGDDGTLGTADDIALTRETIEARKEELQRIRESVDGNLSAVRSTEAFSNALDRLAGNLADTVLGEAQREEEEARRERNRRQAELDSLPADATPAERKQAEEELYDAIKNDFEAGFQADEVEDERRRIRADRRRAEDQFQRDSRAGELGADLQRDIAERDKLQARVDSGEATANDRNRLDRLEARIDRSFEESEAGRNLERRSDELDQQQQRRRIIRDRQRAEKEQRRQSIERGQELLNTPQQQAAKRGLSQFDDAINASLSNAAEMVKQIDPDVPELEDGILSLEELGNLVMIPRFRGTIESDFMASLQQARDNITGNISAQVAQFDRERARPSRQAMQAQDINTQQGRAELNRLLRGDDANRNQPVLEGIKEQTATLKAIDGRIAEVTRVVSVAGD